MALSFRQSEILELARADLENSVIRAPIDGIVLSRTAEVGQIVASSLNAPVLFTLAGDLSQMQLQVDIDEADIGRIATGNEASFTVDAFPGRSFPARIAQVRYAPETTDNVVTYKAVLTVENPEGLLRPGMFATVALGDEGQPGLLVPSEAVIRTGARTLVMLALFCASAGHWSQPPEHQPPQRVSAIRLALSCMLCHRCGAGAAPRLCHCGLVNAGG